MTAAAQPTGASGHSRGGVVLAVLAAAMFVYVIDTMPSKTISEPVNVISAVQ